MTLIHLCGRYLGTRAAAASVGDDKAALRLRQQADEYLEQLTQALLGHPQLTDAEFLAVRRAADPLLNELEIGDEPTLPERDFMRAIETALKRRHP